MEYSGFSLYVGATLTWAGVLLWASAPKSVLNALTIYYYPSRWWAVAVPAFVLVLLAYVYVALGSYNLEVLTRKPTSLETVTDAHANIEERREFLARHSNAVKDLPLGSVNKVLYGHKY